MRRLGNSLTKYREIMKTQRKITCPNCQSDLSVDQLLVQQFEESIRKDLQSELEMREQELIEKKEEYSVLSFKLQSEKEDFQETIEKTVREKVKSKEKSLKDSIREQIESEKKQQLSELEDELQKKSSQLIELNKTKAKMQRLSREFEEKEAQIHLKMEQELSERLKQTKESLRGEIQLESALIIKEKENIIDSLKTKLDDARQKATQGSMQRQGEAQELLLEEMLRDSNPTDVIEEIKKGANGADCIQRVMLPNGAEAGQILYESKNTKHWSNGFIKKLKQDNLKTKADIMVIITKTMPGEVEGKYGLLYGVWVTTLENARDLSLLLRFGLFKTHAVMMTQEGKKDKMSLLYDYLSSEEFRATFTSILDGFKSIQDSHHDEQRKMQLLWKRRAKHLEQVLASTIDFYGSIKGISENSIPTIPMLEIKQAN